MIKKIKDNWAEFFRYVLVGGSAFVIDFASMCIFKEIVFKGNHVFISVFIGYMLGLIYNFILSNHFVFENGLEKIQGKEITSFIIFAIIGIIGLGLTEVLMFFFVKLLTLHYMFAKIVVAGIVLFWNYIARKIIIYK